MFKKTNIFLSAIIVTLVFLSVIGCGQAITEDTQSFATVETVEPVATTDISGIKTEPVESEVIAGDIAWKVLNVNEQGPSIISSDNYAYEATRGKFVILEFMVKNNSEDSKILYDLNVIDSKGRVYTLCLPAYAYFTTTDRACSIVDIVPGVEYTFDEPFDVSPDSEGLVLEVTDLNNPAEEKSYIDIGL